VANALDVTSFGSGGSVTCTNVKATLESGESSPTAPIGNSVWYRWTAPASWSSTTGFLLTTRSARSVTVVSTVVDLFLLPAGMTATATTMNSLFMFGSYNFNSSTLGTIMLPCNAIQPSMRYYFRVSGYSTGNEGPFMLTWGPITSTPCHTLDVVPQLFVHTF
jgi:hypothetical protein